MRAEIRLSHIIPDKTHKRSRKKSNHPAEQDGNIGYCVGDQFAKCLRGGGELRNFIRDNLLS